MATGAGVRDRYKRWLVYAAVAVVFAVVCFFLANWQYVRGQQAKEVNAILSANFSTPTKPLSELVSDSAYLNPRLEWRQASVWGHYDYGEQLLLRNRPLNSRAGLEVLTPLVLDSNELLLVRRGWIPADDNLQRSRADEISDSQTIQIRLRRSSLGRAVISNGQINQLSLKEIASYWQKIYPNSKVIEGYYGVLASGPGEAPGSLLPEPDSPPLYPLEITAPYQNEGMHWSYAVQWVLFAAMGFLALTYGVRSERRAAKKGKQPPGPPRKKRLRDEEIEDAILEGRTRY